jgi:predicted Zn-dependent peptidase
LEFLSHTLENGLEVVAERNGDAYSTAVAFFVKTGSRDETDALAGVSHFLEHMVFKGTPSRTADQVNREFDEMGANYNACTGEENTIYHAAVLPEYQQAAVELLGDILRPSLREDDFQTEKQVIIEEIRMYEDSPPFGADDRCKAAYFGAHPLARSILGTVGSITDLDVDSMRDYFRRRYSPGNVALIATGRIDFDALVKTAERACGGWEPLETTRKSPKAMPRDAFEVIRKDAATQQYAIQLAPGPAAESDERYAAKLLANVLGDDSGSRLYWELIDTGLAEQAGLSHCEYQGVGTMMTYLGCDPENAAGNLQRILDVYRRVEAEGITPAELDQAKSKVRSRIVLSSERPRGRLFSVGSNWIYRQAYQSVTADLAAIAAVTPEAVAAILEAHPLTRSTTVTIGPLSDVAAPV